MEAHEIQQMFLDSATLRHPSNISEDELQKIVIRFNELRTRYMAEYLSADSEPQAPSLDWKSAMQYLAMLFQRMDITNPEASDTNRQVWNIIKPAVLKYYDPDNS